MSSDQLMRHALAKFDLTGRTAVITGGGTGLGYNMTRALARSGARVLITARRADVLSKAAEELNTEIGAERVCHHTVDLSERASVNALAEHAVDRFGGVDIFIGNAAQDFLEPVDDILDESIDQILQVNLTANVQLVRAFLPGMRARRWGRILFSSSASTVCAPANDHMSMYTATKGALNAFTRTAANETGPDGVTVNTLILGLFLTDMVKEAIEGYAQAYGPEAGAAFNRSFTNMTSLDRLGECEDVEGLVQLLASDAGGYITGANIAIDGGLSVMLRPRVEPGTSA
jgi:gluconate 5-dehydrogenase